MMKKVIKRKVPDFNCIANMAAMARWQLFCTLVTRFAYFLGDK